MEGRMPRAWHTAEQTLPGSMRPVSRDNHESWPADWTEPQCGKWCAEGSKMAR